MLIPTHIQIQPYKTIHCVPCTNTPASQWLYSAFAVLLPCCTSLCTCSSCRSFSRFFLCIFHKLIFFCFFHLLFFLYSFLWFVVGCICCCFLLFAWFVTVFLLACIVIISVSYLDVAALAVSSYIFHNFLCACVHVCMCVWFIVSTFFNSSVFMDENTYWTYCFCTINIYWRNWVKPFVV